MIIHGTYVFWDARAQLVQNLIRRESKRIGNSSMTIMQLKSENQTLQSKNEHLISEVHELRTEYGAQL